MSGCVNLFSFVRGFVFIQELVLLMNHVYILYIHGRTIPLIPWTLNCQCANSCWHLLPRKMSVESTNERCAGQSDPVQSLPVLAEGFIFMLQGSKGFKTDDKLVCAYLTNALLMSVVYPLKRKYGLKFCRVILSSHISWVNLMAPVIRPIA